MPKIIRSGINYTPDFPDIPEQISSDWFGMTTSEGLILNKPPVNWDGDVNTNGTRIGDTVHNVASGLNSIAEGQETTASGNNSHAEGLRTIAEGNQSHTEGENTRATAPNSHAEGVGTITPNIMGAHVQGKYNTNPDNNNYVDIVGWGTNTTSRKNISALTADGRLILADGLTIGADVNSHGGYTIPIPSGLEYGKQYALSIKKDAVSGAETVNWFELVQKDVDTSNMYTRDASATGAGTGPFTIYEGTTIPDAALGKVGDIYFKHS